VGGEGLEKWREISPHEHLRITRREGAEGKAEEGEEEGEKRESRKRRGSGAMWKRY
jgi:hypothetical protein